MQQSKIVLFCRDAEGREEWLAVMIAGSESEAIMASWFVIDAGAWRSSGQCG